MLYYLAVALYVIDCLFLCIVVLLQPGKGDGMGAAFGGSSTGTVFGGRGASTVLPKMTPGAAVLFMVLSIILARASADSSSVDGSLAAPDEAVAAASPTAAGEESAEDKKFEVPAADGTTATEAAVAAPAAGTTGDAP